MGSFKSLRTILSGYTRGNLLRSHTDLIKTGDGKHHSSLCFYEINWIDPYHKVTPCVLDKHNFINQLEVN
jgi:hypothetical protein